MLHKTYRQMHKLSTKWLGGESSRFGSVIHIRLLSQMCGKASCEPHYVIMENETEFLIFSVKEHI